MKNFIKVLAGVLILSTAGAVMADDFDHHEGRHEDHGGARVIIVPEHHHHYRRHYRRHYYHPKPKSEIRVHIGAGDRH